MNQREARRIALRYLADCCDSWEEYDETGPQDAIDEDRNPEHARDVMGAVFHRLKSECERRAGEQR